MMQNLHFILPDPVNGYPLDPRRGWFSVLKPAAAVNLIANPSVETNITGYSAHLGATAISRVSTEQRRGVYSIKVDADAILLAGVYYQFNMVAGTTYTFSVDLKGRAGHPYLIRFDNAGAVIASRVVTATGRWQRVSLTTTSPASAAISMTVFSNQALAHTFYTDGWQLEATKYPTTYFDGDSNGFLPGQTVYYWTGTPHASQSVRIYDTGSGGREMNLFDLGLRILAIAGLGLAPFANVSTPFSTGGAYYQRSIIQPRQFMLAGQLNFTNLADLDRARAKLIEYFNPQRLPTPQPLVLRYHRIDECTGEESETLDIPCVYESGLEGSVDNLYQQRLGLVFRQFMPTIYADGEQGATLSTAAVIPNANYAVKRVDGVWSEVSSLINDNVYSINRASNGDLYIGGDFTNVGDANGDGIIKIALDGTISSLGTGVVGTVFNISFSPSGDVYVGGDFTSAGGVANTNRVARWDGATWNSVGGGIITGNYVRKIIFDATGKAYLCGFFTNQGDANGDYITSWNGSTWESLGTGADSVVLDIAFGPDGYLYAGGAFEIVGGITANGIARWNGSTWESLGTGIDTSTSSVWAIAFDDAGNLYAGGVFTSIDGVAANNVAMWNGTLWSPLGSGVNAKIETIAYRNGLLYAAGLFTTAGSISTNDRLAIWNGTSWVPAGIDLPGTSPSLFVLCIYFDRVDDIYLGYTTAGSATAEYLETVTNAGSVPSYAKIKITGPGVVQTIRNRSTGEVIYMDGTAIAAGETLLLNTDPLNFSLVSNLRGNMANHILPGSSPTIRLMPGDNSMGVFMSSTTAASSAVAWWRPAYSSLDGATLAAP